MKLYSLFTHEARDLSDRLVAWRRDFHRHPELGFEEVRTASIVAEHLSRLGLEVSRGVGKTGVVALVEGDELPDDAPTVLLRFDMDALPILEQSDAAYRSQTPGVMHACGHDGHTAIGMGVAELLTRHRQRLTGRVKLVFQPAEEGGEGAKAMIADGVLDRPAVSASFGLHLWNRLPLDTVVVQPGPLWAGADVVELVVHGQGGHGAMPHETVDAILVASQVIVAWQSIVSRNVDPRERAVVSVGTFQSGSAPNVIAGEAVLTGSIRSYSLEMRDFLLRRLEEMAEGVCRAYGAAYTFRFIPGVGPTINSEAGAALMREVAEGVVGAGQVTQIEPMMVGEDMSEFLSRAPGCFILLGAADASRPQCGPHHNPTFDFDERMLSTGVALLASAAVRSLDRRSARPAR